MKNIFALTIAATLFTISTATACDEKLNQKEESTQNEENTEVDANQEVKTVNEEKTN